MCRILWPQYALQVLGFWGSLWIFAYCDQHSHGTSVSRAGQLSVWYLVLRQLFLLGLLGLQPGLHLCLPVLQLINAILMLYLRHLFLTQEQKRHCYQWISGSSGHTSSGLVSMASVLEGIFHKSWESHGALEMRMPNSFQAT